MSKITIDLYIFVHKKTPPKTLKKYPAIQKCALSFLWSFDMYMWPQIDPFNASCWVLVHIHRWLSRNTFFTQKVRTPYCEIHCHDLDFTKKLIHFSSLHKDAFWRDLIRWHIFSNRLILRSAHSHCLDLVMNGLLTRRNFWHISGMLENYTIPKWKEFLKSREPILRKSYLSTFIHINKHMDGARGTLWKKS